jgi:ABC-2 type transport system permease protein
MLNLLRSDFYRLVRSKSFYICAIVAIALNSLNLLIMYWASKVNTDQKDLYASLLPKDGIDFALKSMSDSNAMTIISVFVSIFVVAEFSHGTMKNVVSKGFSKIPIYFSKLITMLVAGYLIILGTIIGAAVSATIITGKFGTFTGDYFVQILKTTGMELLLFLAFTALLLLVATLVRNLGGVIAINFIGLMTVLPLLFLALQYLIKGKIKITTYDLFYNISYFTGNLAATGTDYLRGVLVGLAFLIIATALGIFAFIKSDIK